MTNFHTDGVVDGVARAIGNDTNLSISDTTVRYLSLTIPISEYQMFCNDFHGDSNFHAEESHRSPQLGTVTTRNDQDIGYNIITCHLTIPFPDGISFLSG